MNIACVAALDRNGAIGKNQELPWHLPEDFKWFRRRTMGKTIVMGRKTFESLPHAPLKDRMHWVLTRQSHCILHHPAVRTFQSLPELFCAAAQAKLTDLMIIGGGEIYRLFLPYANRLYITHVATELDRADTFFPRIDFKRWTRISQQDFECDARHLFSFSCCEYRGEALKNWGALLG